MEFALLLPVFLVLLLGVIDLGRAVYAYNTLSNAAREGARVAVIPANTDAEVRNAVKQKAVSLNLTDGDISITARNSGDPVTVAVQHEFRPVTLLVADAIGAGSITLRARSTMYVEGAVP